jgi:hypothetical protein
VSALPNDPRTAARVARLRAACDLPITRVHGSLAGRAGGEVLDAAMEPDGSHVALVLRDAIERWSLDPIDCVGRWEARAPFTACDAVCVGKTPSGLRVNVLTGLWRATLAGVWEPLHEHPSTWAHRHAPDVCVDQSRSEVRVVDLADGATLRVGVTPAAAGEMYFAPGGRFVLHRRASDEFLVWEASSDAAGEPWRIAAYLPLPSRMEHNPHSAVTLDVASRGVAITTGVGVLVGRWDDWRNAAVIPDTSRHTFGAAFVEGGATLVLREAGRVLRVDVATRSVRALSELPRVDVFGIRTAHDDARVIVVVDGALHVLDAGGDGFRSVAYDPATETRCAVGTPDGRAVVTATADGVVRVRDRATGEVTALAEVEGRPTHLAVSPDGRELLVTTEVGDLLRVEREASGSVERLARAFGSGASRSGGFAASRDGRRVAICQPTRLGGRLTVVDLATRTSIDLRARGHATPKAVAFTDEGRVRLVVEETQPEADVRAALCLEYDEAGTARELGRYPFPIAQEVGVSWRSELAISRDGRTLWGAQSIGGEPRSLAFAVALRGADDAATTWPLDGGIRSCRAGNTHLAVSTWDDALWLVDVRGDAHRIAWPSGCEPLAFAPDDGALWVRDATGLVVEVSTRG